MVDRDDYYSNHWGTKDTEDWLKIPLIAAPLMIVFGLVLITHRICSRRSLSRIYKPCSCRSPHHDPVYVPTTCAFGQTDVHDQHDEHVIYATDASVIGVVERGSDILGSYRK